MEEKQVPIHSEQMEKFDNSLDEELFLNLHVITEYLEVIIIKDKELE